MLVLDNGHHYVLGFLDGEPEQLYSDRADDLVGQNELVFVKRMGEKYPGNEDAHPGTTMQEVLRALIDRVKYVHAQLPCSQNERILENLRHTIYLLEERAAIQHNRPFLKSWWEIEKLPTCSKCLHIGCGGECRE